MFLPKISSIYSTQFDTDAGPRDVELFCEWLTVEVEAHDGARIYEEEFSVGVASVAWITRESAIHGAVWGHGYLMLARWDIATVRERIEQLCDAAQAQDWNAVVAKLKLYMNTDESAPDDG